MLVILILGAIIAYVLIKGLTINPVMTPINSQPDRSPEVTPVSTVYEESGYNTAPY